MSNSTPNLSLAKLNKDTKELVELINNYTDDDKQFESIIKLTTIIMNTYNTHHALHTVRDYIEDKQGNNSTLYYKLFLDNFDLSLRLKNKIEEENQFKGAHNIEKSNQEKQIKNSIRQALFSSKGTIKVNHEQTLFEYLFHNSEYTTWAELEIKSFLSKQYVISLPNYSKDSQQNQKETKVVMEATVLSIIDNLQNALKNDVLNTTQELEKATNFEDIKKTMYAYLDNQNPATVPTSLREHIAWFQPFMLAFDLVLTQEHLQLDKSDNQNRELFLEQMTASESQILINSYRNDCINYVVSTYKADKELVFLDTSRLSNSYIVNGLLNMTNIEIFQTKYTENFIFNEKQKIESSMENKEASEVNNKRTKI